MADENPDPEANLPVDDRQPLLSSQHSAVDTINATEPSSSSGNSSSSLFQSVLQWSQSFRNLGPILTRATSAESSSSPTPRPSELSPSAPISARSATSSQHGSPRTGSPSVGRSHLSKSHSKIDLETAALRRINSVCSEGSGIKRLNGSCIICMETLTPEEFASGEAMTLDCMCKGEMALRHKSCAEKWAQVKGSNICDVCKAPIANLPPLPVVEPSDAEDVSGDVIITDLGDQFEDALRRRDEIPAAADYIFDCIRVTWVSMIICILFFEFPVSKSFVTGLMVGIAYTAFCKAMHRSAQYRALASSPDTPNTTAATLVLA